jgi:hypothetical protein
MYGRGDGDGDADGELGMDGGGDGDGDSMFLPLTKDPLKLQPNALSAPFIDVERRDLVSFSSRKEKLRGKLPSQQTPRGRRHGLTNSWLLQTIR